MSIMNMMSAGQFDPYISLLKAGAQNQKTFILSISQVPLRVFTFTDIYTEIYTVLKTYCFVSSCMLTGSQTHDFGVANTILYCLIFRKVFFYTYSV